MTILIILLILAVAVLAASYAVYRVAFHSPNRTQNDDYCISRGEQMDAQRDTIIGMIAKLNERPYEEVYITSDDGLRLRGRYYRGREGAPIVIGCHGYRGTPSRDFSGGTAMYLGAGFHLLMIEQRAHCGSEGHTITFGVRERYDCLRWIDYVRGRFGADRPILLGGISMGAATVLMASGLDLPDNVKGIVADAPYTSPGAIIRKVCGDLHIPAGLAWPFLWLGARLFGGFDLSQKDADAAEAVRAARVPILLIHGEDDRFVPCDMGRKIAAANPALIEIHTFPEAGHGLSFLVDRPRYERIAQDFFARVFPEFAAAEDAVIHI